MRGDLLAIGAVSLVAMTRAARRAAGAANEGDAPLVAAESAQIYARTGGASDPEAIQGILGSSRVMKQLRRDARRAAASDAPVVVLGETGTGKEAVARAIHDLGPRARGPFVAMNMAAIPPDLTESLLFGHQRGAFTGAVRDQAGLFQAAHGGTLFLDEIGDLDARGQAALLRALQTGRVRRVGATREEEVDVRVVSATHKDLARMVEEGSFREDLFYRLTVLPLRTPRLVDHLEDLDEIVFHLLSQIHPSATITPSALAKLGTYDWPGNVRELRSVLQRAVALGGPHVKPASIDLRPDALYGAEADSERQRILHALHRSGGNKAQAAKILGMPRTTLLYLMNKLEISS